MHPASKYNEIRHHVFSTYHKYNLKTALSVLQSRAPELYSAKTGYVGLEAELFFYDKERDKLDLQATLDAGDKCDFTGIYKDKHARFDTTTNIDYKSLEDYESFQRTGRPYYLVVYDRKRQTHRIIDINFPFCPDCKGRMIDGLILKEIEIETSNLTPHGSTMQTLIRICTKKPDYHNFIVGDYYYDLDTKRTLEFWLKEDFVDAWDDDDFKKMIVDQRKKWTINHNTYLRKLGQSLTPNPLGFIGEFDYWMFWKDKGEYYTKIVWTHEMLENYFPADMELYIDSI